MLTRLFALIALCLLPVSAAAQIPDNLARVDLLPGWRTGDGRHIAALRVRLAPGWKTYWRAPGEAGIPPQFDWSGSRNLASVALHWPTPVAFSQGGLTSVGYKDRLILPVTLRPRHEGQPIELDLQVALGICEEICVPVGTRLDATLPAGETRPDARIRAALADRPLEADEAGAGAMACTVTPIADGARIEARLSLPPMGGREHAVFELADPGLWVSGAETRRDGATLTVSAEIVPPPGQPLSIDRSALRLTVLGTRGAVEIEGCG